MAEPWTWKGKVGGVDGQIPSAEIHRAALAEALGTAVARMRALEAAGAAMVAQVERLRDGLAQAGFEVGERAAHWTWEGEIDGYQSGKRRVVVTVHADGDIQVDPADGLIVGPDARLKATEAALRASIGLNPTITNTYERKPPAHRSPCPCGADPCADGSPLLGSRHVSTMGPCGSSGGSWAPPGWPWSGR